MGGIWVELHVIPPIFHPYSTLHKPLIIKVVMPLRWKGGITNDKKYLFGNTVEKVLTTVKNRI